MGWRNVYKKFETNQVFSEVDAWLLFRIAAIAEAVGWTMLIFGIVFEQYIIPGNRVPVVIAGRTHGVLFLVYALAAAGLYPNLRWSKKQTLLAVLASAPPYGSLLFERFANYQRRNKHAKIYGHYMTYILLRA